MTSTGFQCDAAVLEVCDVESRTAVLERSNGMCEMCGARVPIELHHLTYRPSNPVAVMDNLFAVCRPCHRDIHGTEGNADT